jgi:superfamily II DNA/RNA helicase
MLFSGGYLKPLRMCFDVLYREEKLASEGFFLDGAAADETEAWDGDAERDEASFKRDWRKDHHVGQTRRAPGPALGGKGKVGLGEGRDFRRQYIFAAATVMSSGKKTPGAMIKYGFPDATWIEGRRLHRSVASVNQTWVQATLETRAAALADAVGLTASADAPREKTMVFVNTAAAADEIAREFNALGLPAAAFHADMPSHDRALRLKDFADGALAALVCTDSAARGVDIPGVAHVVQAEFAGNAVDYLHRIGRTARAGATGRVTNICLPGSADLVRAVRDAESKGESVETAFSRKRSFRKKQKKYGDSRRGVADLSRRKSRE